MDADKEIKAIEDRIKEVLNKMPDNRHRHFLTKIVNEGWKLPLRLKILSEAQYVLAFVEAAAASDVDMEALYYMCQIVSISPGKLLIKLKYDSVMNGLDYVVSIGLRNLTGSDELLEQLTMDEKKALAAGLFFDRELSWDERYIKNFATGINILASLNTAIRR